MSTYQAGFGLKKPLSMLASPIYLFCNLMVLNIIFNSFCEIKMKIIFIEICIN